MEKIYELFHGDCLEVMKKIKDKSIDLILCDPPFGVTRCDWDKVINFDLLWEQYNRIIKDNGVIILFSIQPFTTQLINSNLKHYRYSWYWVKNTCTGFTFAKYQPMRKVEDINVFYKNKPMYIPQGLVEIKDPKVKKGRKDGESGFYGVNKLNKEYVQRFTNYPNNVLYFNKESKTVHPSQKPPELLEYLIKTYTVEGAMVLDTCMGGGNTGVASANTNRRFKGIEITEKYFNISKNRVERAYNKKVDL